ncbi:o-succinylbenzoate synthase [Patiriisocius sp. Uisw_017]|jgi:o-succinylbenzoate synthase|uniref:o-succinylbenzoate synthase n=1 Tax=Patiriisocius sp. Uisw_017 TaxID=3230968 RepID=UPI0039E9B929
MKAAFQKHTLQFKHPSGTSRGILKTKDTYFLIIESDGKKGIGECGVFAGLSIDPMPAYESRLQWVCDNVHLGKEQLVAQLVEFPSIQIGVEIAFASLASTNPFEIFSSEFLSGAPISINGLVWMGDQAFMKKQIAEKLKSGFSCIKMKIGAIDFTAEIDLLKSIRKEFSASEIELRVDANGAFKPEGALEKLKALSDLDLHSIEQPIKQGQWEQMASLCEHTPLDIALDEELIGVFSAEKQEQLLETIRPQYIILKPTLIGGFAASDAWIKTSEEKNIAWWITSALESNVGLNAISQYTFIKNSKLLQGLGTGNLYTNNIESPLEVINGTLRYNPNNTWNFNW